MASNAAKYLNLPAKTELNGTPIGGTIFWVSTAPIPEGFLAMLGQAPSEIALYPELLKKYPNGLPNTEHDFVRGAGPNRPVGRKESDMVKRHSHNLNLSPSSPGANKTPSDPLNTNTSLTRGLSLNDTNFSVSSPQKDLVVNEHIGAITAQYGLDGDLSTLGNENRPRNLSAFYIVRAFFPNTNLSTPPSVGGNLIDYLDQRYKPKNEFTGRKNWIINGNFIINNRNLLQNTTNIAKDVKTWITDRWFFVLKSSNPAQSALIPFCYSGTTQWYRSFGTISHLSLQTRGATTNDPGLMDTASYLAQQIEGELINHCDSPVTLSFLANIYNDPTLTDMETSKTIKVSVYAAYVDSNAVRTEKEILPPTSFTVFANTSNSSEASVRKIVTFNIPKTEIVGLDVYRSFIEIRIHPPVGKTILDIADVQLELNDHFTGFERRSIADEELLCRRYFEIIRYALSTQASIGNPTTTVYFSPKRVIPGVSIFGNIANASPTNQKMYPRDKSGLIATESSTTTFYTAGLSHMTLSSMRTYPVSGSLIPAGNHLHAILELDAEF